MKATSVKQKFSLLTVSFGLLQAVPILTTIEEKAVLTTVKHKSLQAEAEYVRAEKKRLWSEGKGFKHEYTKNTKRKTKGMWSKKQWEDINLRVCERALLNGPTGSEW